ncbi:MAG: ABC transporter ATP-binding protein [Candidatus Thorarchaeota archaeon]
MVFFEMKNLSFKYQDHWVLSNVSFQGKKGELIAIVGPSGCGKTTLLKTVIGILNPQIGSIFIDQKDITNESIDKREIGYVPQDQSLFPHLSVYDNVAFGLVSQKWRKEHIKERVLELAKLGGIAQLLKRKPHELSGGQQQRVSLLRALAPSPKLLLLDEPLSNIDAHLREQLAIYIKNIQRISAITTLFVTHDLNEAKMLADKLLVLNKGKILQAGSPMEVALNPRSIEVAFTLGMKNLYKILSITEIKDALETILSTEVGKIHIPISLLREKMGTPSGVYIDPSKIIVSKEKFTEYNSFDGEIIAIIPELMVHQSTVLIKVIDQQSEAKKGEFLRDSPKNNVIRVQIPLKDENFEISDRVGIRINPEALKLYY